MTPTDERKYVRVYYSVINDERFADIFHDSRRLGTWLQLLLVADAMFPADAPIPAFVHMPSFRSLVAAGLIEDRPHRHYRVHGLVSERNARASAGRTAAGVRWQSPRNANALPTQSEGNADPMPSRAEQSRDKQSKDEQRESAREVESENGHDDRLDGPLAYSEVTLRYPPPNSDLHEWTVRLAEEHGAGAFQAALATEFTINRSAKDLMSRTESRLSRRADEAAAEVSKRYATNQAAARAERTARELRETREKEARIAAQPMKPLAELMPDLRIKRPSKEAS